MSMYDKNHYNIVIILQLKKKKKKNILQHHSSKASILWCSAFFMVQLSHPYLTTGKPYIWLYEPLWIK